MSHVNQIYKIRNLLIFFLFMIAPSILFSAGPASAAEELRRGDEILLDTYYRLESKLEKNSFGFPLLLESFESDDRVHVDVYGIFDHSFSSVLNVLKVPANWCDIVTLDPNIKVCTYREQPDSWLLTLYFGRQTYQPPEDTRQVIYHYRNVEQGPGYLGILLDADEGPFGTRDHRMRFEAMPIGEGKTFVHVSYAYSDSAALRLAEKVYYATLGRAKVGFTVTGTDKNGNPVYIGGPRGALERSVVRSHFAVQSFMDTLGYPEESRFSMRTINWYDLTSRYRRQLFQIEKKDYLRLKTKEHKDQIRLQLRIGVDLQ